MNDSFLQFRPSRSQGGRRTLLRWTVMGGLGLMGVAAGAMTGCQPEEKLVRYKPFLAGLENVKTGTSEVVDDRAPKVTAPTPEQASGETVLADGTIKLTARSALQLMGHIQKTILEDDPDLFAEQVLSQITRQEYIARGLDPRDAFDKVVASRADIGKLFNRMPMGEHTPLVIMRRIGPKMFRVEITGQGAMDLEYTGFDMVLESNAWKLRWFVGA